MRDRHAARLGWMLELDVAALVSDLMPAIRFQRRDDGPAIHCVYRYTLITGRQQRVDKGSGRPGSRSGRWHDRARCAQVAPQRLLSRTTLEPARLLPLGGTALLRKVGETFHCRPSSVTTVTVFLL